MPIHRQGNRLWEFQKHVGSESGGVGSCGLSPSEEEELGGGLPQMEAAGSRPSFWPVQWMHRSSSP